MTTFSKFAEPGPFEPRHEAIENIIESGIEKNLPFYDTLKYWTIDVNPYDNTVKVTFQLLSEEESLLTHGGYDIRKAFAEAMKAGERFSYPQDLMESDIVGMHFFPEDSEDYEVLTDEQMAAIADGYPNEQE